MEMIDIPASEFCDSVRDGTHDSPKPVESPGKPLVTSKHMKGGRINLEDAYLISGSDFEKVNQRSQVHQWDVLISMIGTLGELVLVKDEPNYAIKNIGLFKTKSKYDGLWLYYYLQSPKAKNHMHTSAQGSTQQYLSLKTLRGFPLSVPDSETDKRAICEVLKTIDDKIELNQKMNQTLEAIAKAIFTSWFVDFDPVRAKAEGRPTGLPPEISDLFPDELVDSEIGEIPKGWDVLKVKDEAIRLKVGKLYSNKTVKEEGSIPVLDQSDAGIIGYHSNDDFVSASLENPVFTFANHTCKMRLMFSDFGVIQNVIPIQSKSYPTIWFYLRTLGIKQFEEYKGHIPDFMDTQLCFPSVQLAKSLNQLVTPLFHRIEIANREMGVLSELRDTLLPKLIFGELRIPDAEKFLEEAGI